MKKRNICIVYYDKLDDSFIKEIPIKNCTLRDIEKILLKFYPNGKHIQTDKYGNEYLSGSYDITPDINKALFNKYKIKIDIENFNCQIDENEM